MRAMDYLLSKIEDTVREYDGSRSDEGILSLQVEKIENRGMDYLVFIVKESYSQLRKEYRSYPGNPIILGIIEREKNYDLYIIVKQEIRWKEFDILTKENWLRLKTNIDKILKFLKENHKIIEGPTDHKLNEFIQRLIDTEKRVKEGGLLIAAYINYLESHVKNLRKIIPKGWGGIVLQLMVLYFLHRRGKSEGIKELRFGVIEAYEEYRKGKVRYSPEGAELWGIFEKDLEKFSEISKDAIFGIEDFRMLREKGIIIANEHFLGKRESLDSFRFENLKAALKKLEKTIFGEEEPFKRAQKELWDKFTGIGIIPLFEVRRWYEAGLIGDIIGGVYEGIKKLEERKRGGIYYTPRFIVEYIVDNTVEPYIKDIVKSISPYSNFDEFIEKADVEKIEEFYRRLLDIKILDPACGTGHFLVYAMEKLYSYYRKVYENVNRGDFKVVILDKNGRREINLWEVEEEALPFVIRQHLILRNNIYGVDIDDYAHQIAKARMLIEVFELYTKEAKEKGYEFPNLEMNIKTGNSLIGFASWDEIPKEKQKTLFDFDESTGISKINKIKRLMRKVKETGRTDEYEKIMKDVRDLMNDVFVEYLHKKGVDIKKRQLGYDEEGLRAFHWIIEFPDVFEVNNPGFDIVVGNPPYLGESDNKKLFRIYAKILPMYYEGKMDLWYFFMHRGLDLLRKNGYLSFITSNYWVTATGAGKLRKRIFHDISIIDYINFGENKVFSSAKGVHTNVITLKKDKPIYNRIRCTIFINEYSNGENLIEKIPLELNFETLQAELIIEDWDDYIHFLPTGHKQIIEFIIKQSDKLKNRGFLVKQGLITGINKISEKQLKKYKLQGVEKEEGVFVLDKKTQGI